MDEPPHRCPHCPEHLSVDQIDDHVATAHQNIPPCTATLEGAGLDGTLHCAFRAGHRSPYYPDYDDWHASRWQPLAGRTVWKDSATGAAPHTGATQPVDELTPSVWHSDGSLCTDDDRAHCGRWHAQKPPPDVTAFPAGLRNELAKAIHHATRPAIRYGRLPHADREKLVAQADAVMGVVGWRERQLTELYQETLRQLNEARHGYPEAYTPGGR